MKRNILSILSLSLAALFCIVAPSCGDKSGEAAPAAKKATTAKAGELPNYRYVDLDTILEKYNLAKDYNEEIMRLQSQMESTAKAHENKIQEKAKNMQNKMQNNSYLSRDSYEADERELGKMQANAQNALGNMQKNYEAQAMKAQKTVNDSITAYIKEYNKAHGYDAIFFKAATLYIDPALDITNEVLEGLNVRYNKVKKD